MSYVCSCKNIEKRYQNLKKKKKKTVDTFAQLKQCLHLLVIKTAEAENWIDLTARGAPLRALVLHSTIVPKSFRLAPNWAPKKYEIPSPKRIFTLSSANSLHSVNIQHSHTNL